MNTDCTLLNYPGFTFTGEQLVSFQDQGAKFESNAYKGASSFHQGKQWFDAWSKATIDYRVVETPENKALFEKLAGIKLKKANPRVHAELIQAWALDDSLVIEVLGPLGDWYEAHPGWHKDKQYRISPSTDPEAITKGISQGISTCKAMLVLSEEV